MDAEQALERWRHLGGSVLKSTVGLLLALVLGVFAYIAHSSYTARAGADNSAASPTPVLDSPLKAESSPSSAADASDRGNETTEQGHPASTGGISAPANDSIKPNPPNGMTFGGSGHFQLYRQGDITWRLNTNTGETCIAFATSAEWKQARVRRAACPKPGRS